MGFGTPWLTARHPGAATSLSPSLWNCHFTLLLQSGEIPDRNVTIEVTGLGTGGWLPSRHLTRENLPAPPRLCRCTGCRKKGGAQELLSASAQTPQDKMDQS